MQLENRVRPDGDVVVAFVDGRQDVAIACDFPFVAVAAPLLLFAPEMTLYMVMLKPNMVISRQMTL